MAYLVQNKSGYCFRLTIPSDLQPRVGLKEIRRSLKRTDHKTASHLALLLAGKIHQLFRKLRDTPMGLSPHQIKQMIDGFIHECLEYEEEQRASYEPIYDGQGDTPYIQDEHLTQVDDFTEDAQQQLKSGDYSQVARVVDHILEVNSCNIPKDSMDYKKMCRETLKAQIKVLGIEKRRNEGDYSDDDRLPPPPEVSNIVSAPPAPIQVKPTGPLITDLIKEWKDEHTLANLWKPRTITAYNGHFRVMMQILGEDTPIGHIDHPTVKAVKDTLLQLPGGMNKKKAFAEKTVQEIIKINETEQEQTMSISTVNRYLITLGAFFKWCVGNGYMDMNYAEGKKIKSKKVSPDKQRDAFSTDDLNALFKAPGYTKSPFKEPYQFWLPILGLYTGARLNELCQLRLDDIETIDGIYTFTFQEDAQDETISVKSDSGHRTIPIHPFIAEELNLKGYVKYLRNKDEIRLFPELPYQNDNYGHKATKWFGRFRKSCGIDSPKKVYHSFRHTLTDNLKQQLIKDSLIDELTGHALQGESMGRYGKKYRIDVLYNEAVIKLDYSGVKMDHLKNHKFTNR